MNLLFVLGILGGLGAPELIILLIIVLPVLIAIFFIRKGNKDKQDKALIWLILMSAVIINVNCKKKKGTDSSTTPPTQSTPTPTITPTVTPTNEDFMKDTNWKLYKYENLGSSTFYTPADSNDIYRFQKTGQSKFTIDQGNTKVYATDPTTLTGSWSVSGSTLYYSHNGLGGAGKQFDIINCANDTFIIQPNGSMSFGYFSKIP